MELMEIGKTAREMKYELAKLSTEKKNQGILAAAEGLERDADRILAANAVDMENGKKRQMPQGLLDRLLLTEDRIHQMAEGLRQVVALPDPIGEMLGSTRRPNGLEIGKRRMPIGVVGVIYEARPNVTADVFGLCFKTGNAVILKGGSDAISSNKAIVESIQRSLESCGLMPNSVQLIEDTSRATTEKFMKMNEYVDLLIPRGGAGLIRTVVENATIPVIETGTGNCHIYVDETADLAMACDIVENAKTQRIGVCNACESLVVHEDIAGAFLPMLEARLRAKQVEIRSDSRAGQYLKESVPATEEDWGKEYLDLIISVKTVSDIDEAIRHINTYNTGHSDAIVTTSYAHARQFLDEIDAACVYVNASTRFTDGFEFGFGAEIGISTQKLHARGPMGLLALTTTKYIIYGNGQVRP